MLVTLEDTEKVRIAALDSDNIASIEIVPNIGRFSEDMGYKVYIYLKSSTHSITSICQSKEAVINLLHSIYGADISFSKTMLDSLTQRELDTIKEQRR